MKRSINRHAPAQRSAMRALGFLLVAVGGVLVLVGGVSFFGSFGSMRPPQYFWCAFIGLPLTGIGIMLLKFGYMGAVSRYVAGEIAPVATDTINHVVRGTRAVRRGSSRSVGERSEDGAGAAASTVRERLEKLEGLRRDGLIDAEDYEEQKDRILSDL